MSSQKLIEGTKKNRGVGCDLYGKDRLRVAKILKDILRTSGIEWFLDAGSLLGAYRNGKFIQHDDDLDFGLLIRLESFDVLEKLLELSRIFFVQLPYPLEARLVTTYTDKIEVYDPTFGKFILADPSYDGADFHFVTVDLQTYPVDNRGIVRSTHRRRSFEVMIDDVLPLKTIDLEGESFPCPCRPKTYLEANYGCIEIGAIYDPVTRKYIKA